MDGSSFEEQAAQPELSAWRRERIRMMTSPASTVTEAVIEACGSAPSQVTRLTEGFSNEVYAVRTRHGDEVIVRIHWWSSRYFEEESWALAHCRQLGLPTPQILLLRQNPSGDPPRVICVETRLPGQTLATLLASGQVSIPDTYPLLVAAGALLVQLHEIQTTGWGRINALGQGPAAHWTEQVADSTQDASRAASLLDLAQGDVPEALHLLQVHARLLKEVSPRLLHGDLSPQQILVSEGRVSGLIDFEFPRSGDPAWEFAYWDYYTGRRPFRGARLPTSWLREGYQQASALDATFEGRITLWRVALGLELLAYHGIRDDQEPAFLRFLCQQFLQDLEELRRLRVD
jgi:aminoglycoside phosphotransferase (APT) family kinase protein